MKKCYTIIFLLNTILYSTYAQNVGINTTGNAPAATNLLEVLSVSTTASSVAINASHTGNITGTGYGMRIYRTGTATVTNIAADFNVSGGVTNTAGSFTASGAHTTNTAASFSATGAASNYAILVPASSGNVGIGTSTPTATNMVHVISISTIANSVGVYVSHSGAITGTGYALQTSKTGASTLNVGADFTALGASTSNTGIQGTGTGGTGTNYGGAFYGYGSSTTSTSYGIAASSNGSSPGTSIAIGGIFSAYTANSNYAIIVPSGGGNVGIGTSTPSAKAIVEMASTTTGILIPRMTNLERTNIAPGAAANQGLMIYQTDVGTTAPLGIGFYYWDGTAWTGIGSNTSGASSGSFNYSTNMQVQEEFMGNYKLLSAGNSNYDAFSPFSLGWYRFPTAPDIGGTSMVQWGSNGTSDANHPGVTRVMLGSSLASAVTSIYLTSPPIDARTPNFTCSWIINNTSSALSAGAGIANEYFIKAGLMDDAAWTSASTGNPTDGMFFETTTNNGFWYATGVRSAAVSGPTKKSTSIVPALNTWVRLDLKSDATGAIWTFFVNGTLRATINAATERVPAAGTLLVPGIKIAAGASGAHTAFPQLSIDYFYMSSTVTR